MIVKAVDITDQVANKANRFELSSQILLFLLIAQSPRLAYLSEKGLQSPIEMSMPKGWRMEVKILHAFKRGDCSAQPQPLIRKEPLLTAPKQKTSLIGKEVFEKCEIIKIYSAVKPADRYSLFKRAMLVTEIAFGHSASHAYVLVQLPNPSLSICATMLNTRFLASGLPCGNNAK